MGTTEKEKEVEKEEENSGHENRHAVCQNTHLTISAGLGQGRYLILGNMGRKKGKVKKKCLLRLKGKKNLLKTAEVSANLVKMAENLINW